MNRPLIALIFLLSTSLFSATLLAQTTGKIRGQVTDQEGSALPGVIVNLVGEGARGGSRSTVTGANGGFLFASLDVGNYTVTAAMAGFAGGKRENVRVSINTTATVNFILRPESMDESMVVTAERPMVDVTSSSVGTSFDADFIEDMPTRRNFWDMIAVAPGMTQTQEGDSAQIAFGSDYTANSWNIDGLDVTGPDTGNAWWWINPDTIEEVQVMGIGAPAEFGNMTGAAFNIVTKSGSNSLEGGVNFFYQDDSLTSDNVFQDYTDPSTGEVRPIGFYTDTFRNLSAFVSGPIVKDRAWFFLSFDDRQEQYTEAGTPRALGALLENQRYDMKVNFRLRESDTLEFKYHYDDYYLPFGANPNSTLSAQTVQEGINPAWGASYKAVLGNASVLEVSYTGWTGDDRTISATGSKEPPNNIFSNFDSPQYAGGIPWPYEYRPSRDQAAVKYSHFAEDFIKGDHDFKFGVQYTYGEADTVTTAGAGGNYYWRYDYGYEYYGNFYSYTYGFYKYEWQPFHYGAEQESIAFFVDDSWQVNDKLTLNLGMRYDINTADIPAYEVLDNNSQGTGVFNPAVKDVIDWKAWSPRLGFAYQIGDKGTQVLRGSFGVYHDANVAGNWYFPPPGATPFNSLFTPDPAVQDYEIYDTFTYSEEAINTDLQQPYANQWALGWQWQFAEHMSIGVQGVYKEMFDNIGWEILDDGVHETVTVTNPVTGESMDLISVIEQGTIRKGNRPGAGSGAPNANYDQTYKGFFLTFNKLLANKWSMQGSYTWSKSDGLGTQPWSEGQGDPFYSSLSGTDPNAYVNAEQSLKGDRTHVLRFQGFYEMPWDLKLSGIFNYQSGRPYSILTTFRDTVAQGPVNVIVVPANDDNRMPETMVFDLGLSRQFHLGGRVKMKVDLQCLNLFNEDANQWLETTTINGAQLQEPNFGVKPGGYVWPRRLTLRLNLSF